MDFCDRPRAIRQGEELPLDKIEEFLKDTIPGLEGAAEVKQYPSGASNLTYEVSFGRRRMILRRPPFGTKAAGAHDMGREYKVLSALCEHWPYAPRPLAFTEDQSIMGSPFYVMEQLQGIIIRKELPQGLLDSPSRRRSLFERFVNVLYELHSLDYNKIGLGRLGKPKGYVERQVLGWCRRFRAAKTPDVPHCEKIMEWLENNMPPETDKPGIIHNDYKFDNIILDPHDPLKIIGVLDWEMTTVGDPLMDLGSTLGYWVEKNDPPERHQFRTMPTHLEGAMTRKEFVEYYCSLSNLKMDFFNFYNCFGVFRLIVIIQQIYFRYYHGQTRNERFKKYAGAVHVLESAAMRIISG